MSEILKIELYYSKESTLLVRNSSEKLSMTIVRSIASGEGGGGAVFGRSLNLIPIRGQIVPAT